MQKNKIVINNSFGGYRLSKEAEKFLLNCGLQKKDLYNIPRHHPYLVKCVEILGEKASNQYSRLIVVEIEENQYRICEYDGSEWVETPNQLEWITIE